MPIYEYECDSCERRTEAIQKLDDPRLTICPHCGGSLTKLMSAPAFQFKGSGWYVTDYAGKGKPKESSGDGSSPSGGSESKESSSAAAKSDEATSSSSGS